MVEKNANDMIDLNKSRTRLSLGLAITHKNLENDIFKLFLRKKKTLKASEKIEAVLTYADNEIITLHRRVHGEKDISSLDYDQLEKKLLDFFKHDLTTSSFLHNKQKSEETITKF